MYAEYSLGKPGSAIRRYVETFVVTLSKYGNFYSRSTECLIFAKDDSHNVKVPESFIDPRLRGHLSFYSYWNQARGIAGEVKFLKD